MFVKATPWSSDTSRSNQLEFGKTSEIEFDRVSQSQFIIFSGQKEHTDEQVKAAQEFIESNYADKLYVEAIANSVNLNVRSFLRRFKKATSNTPLEYIQRVRVEAAKRKLESTTEVIAPKNMPFFLISSSEILWSVLNSARDTENCRPLSIDFERI